MAQALRRSQFITTYGPGAILEGQQGPRIIPSLERSGIFTNKRPIHNFEISDNRLSSALLDNARIARLPSNAELLLPDAREIYSTDPFPSWALCTKHHILYLKRANDEYNMYQSCPRCSPHKSKDEAWLAVRRQAIRFIMACPKGHLDDVNWRSIIPHKRECSGHPAYLKWLGGGSSLRNINVECPECREPINLGLAYSREWNCTGRLPERGILRYENACDAKAKIIQRGAANLRIPELYSALTIPPSDTRLYRLLHNRSIQDILAMEDDVLSKQELMHKMNKLAKKGRVSTTLIAEIDRFPDMDIQHALAQMSSESLPQDNKTLRLQEFAALQHAAQHGAPAIQSSTRNGPPQFEVIRENVCEYPGPNGHKLRITPISRLRVVMVQKGYRRIDPLLGEMVDIIYKDEEGDSWYPGVELFGEGIFIDLAPSLQKEKYHFSLAGDQIWMAARQHPDQYGQRISEDRQDERDYLHPVFVWWHTFSHRLINALSIDSGYSSAAVRERVYIDIDEHSGKARGGILLYTVQPGGDGTLGGMMTLAGQFDRVLRAALNTIDSCSNDPLCSETHFGEKKYNGSACYACLLVSETSCEHRNTRLDRTLLKENLP